MWYVLLCANYCCFGLQAASRRSLCAGCANYQPPFLCLGFSLYLPVVNGRKHWTPGGPWWLCKEETREDQKSLTADALRTTAGMNTGLRAALRMNCLQKHCRITLQVSVSQTIEGPFDDSVPSIIS